MAMAPQITQFMMNRRLARAIDKLDDGNGVISQQEFDAKKRQLLGI